MRNLDTLYALLESPQKFLKSVSYDFVPVQRPLPNFRQQRQAPANLSSRQSRTTPPNRHKAKNGVPDFNNLCEHLVRNLRKKIYLLPWLVSNPVLSSLSYPNYPKRQFSPTPFKIFVWTTAISLGLPKYLPFFIKTRIRNLWSQMLSGQLRTKYTILFHLTVP